MRVFHYPDPYSFYEELEVHCPTWKQIEEAIRRLNKDEWPFLWMYRTENPYEDDIPDFEIMGGAGHYVIGAKPPGEPHELFYTDNSHGVERIEVWFSDQGALPKHQRSVLTLLRSST